MKLRHSLLLAAMLSAQVFAQENLGYQVPPPSIMALADYQRPPTVSFDHQRQTMLLSFRNTYKSLRELSQPELRLAGLRINPQTNMPTTQPYVNQLRLKQVSTGKETDIKGMPADALISNVKWSPDGKKIGFTNTTDIGAELWVIDVAKASAQRVTGANLNGAGGAAYSWLADSQGMLVKMLPKQRPALRDASRDLPTGPIISTSTGTVSQTRTYADLLKNKIDEANLETLLTSDLVKVALNGKQTVLRKGEMLTEVDVSPDGRFLLLDILQKPFSYLVQLDRFPFNTIVTDLDGKVVKAIHERPLLETMPKGFSATEPGKRRIGWRADKPATLSYVTALDGGDPSKKTEFRDELFSWDAPFTQAPVSLVKLRQRFAGVVWGDDHTAVVSESWYDTRNSKTFLIDPAAPAKEPRLVFDRNIQDIYKNPGRFETRRNQFDRRVLATEDGKAFLIGEGFTREGQFPFIDELDLQSLQTKRLYQATDKDKMETIVSLEDAKKGEVLVSLQSRTDYPNFYMRSVKSGEPLKALTSFANPFAGLKDVHKEVIKYQRKDGVQLSGNLYLPAGYDRSKKEKLPLLIWAYPAEFKDKDSAGQSRHNPNQFTYPSYGSFIYWTTRGYAVLDDAAFPIIGEGKAEPNDTFLTQLVDNAEAAINAVDAMGYIDRNRVAVGGHSYGAFMTANLLTHSKLFACGIARSGAYNRTLTPFGFQNEQRNYWEAPQIYNTMAPFMHADKMKTPLLLVHGEADNNPGTFTLQTERYFQALKGLGAPVRMVILPKESHGYAAKENILHLLWEQDQFLEGCLKKK